MRELRRLGGGAWSDFAILARTRAVLEPIRALCEESAIPVAWREELPPLHRVREIARFLDCLKALGQEPLTPDRLHALVGGRSGASPAGVRREPLTDTTADGSRGAEIRLSVPPGRGVPGREGQPAAAGSSPWRAVVEELVRSWTDEAGEVVQPAARILEFCYETLAEQRRDRSLGEGVLISTLHGAKGMELPHVLIADGGWRAGRSGEDERRLFYVGMTRARETLTLGSVTHSGNPWLDELEGGWLLRAQPPVEPPPPDVVARRYRLLSPADLDLGYAGRQPADHPIHARLAALRTGDPLQARIGGERILLCDGEGFAVARLSRSASAEWLPKLPETEAIRIVALLRRRCGDGGPAFRGRSRADTWEVPLPEFQLGAG
jgi:ATP-dependent DNA helicase RecQ